ncbi:hypothetical protein N0V82_010656 [Gnomoniopsis sp. IMI 355080]|nr:hypothetical protein N0V82_010656 [Gnomoniopsis sp. IMI 355080]
MDPLHKIDSAISVASKDNGITAERHSTDYPQPRRPDANRHADPKNEPSSLDSKSSLEENKSVATPEDKTPQKSASSSSSRPVSPTPQAQSAAMENLVAPLEGANRSPRPDFIDQPGSDWYQTQARPPTPPTYAVEHSGDSSTPSTFVFTAGGGGSTSSAPESAAEEEHHESVDALTQAGTGAIDVDHDQLELESDPGYESDRASFASTSLSSSVRDYLFENGRRYHRFREGRYNFPNDEAEQDREDMKHACVKMLCQNQLYFAPIDEQNLQNVLDIGTGTGIWAIEFGDLFPSADVLGIDLSPIQPDWVPANVHFVVDDAESDWIYPPDHFDYIHTRHTVMAIKDWPKLYREAKEHLRPGGWIESQEIYHYPISANNTMPSDHPIAQYWGLINEGLQRLGIDFHAAAGGKIAAMMREAGYVNVHERIFHVPLGTWPKHPDLKMVGEYWRHVLLVGAQAIALGPLTRGCGWTREQVEVFLIEVRKAYYDNSCLMYMPMYVTYGQKAEE